MTTIRPADVVPECLQRDGLPIDEDACQFFFSARREVMLEKNPEPLKPLTREQSERWQRHLRATRPGADKPIRAKPVVVKPSPALDSASPVPPPSPAPSLTESKPLKESEPWKVLGVSRATYFARKAEGKL